MFSGESRGDFFDAFGLAYTKQALVSSLGNEGVRTVQFAD